MKKYKTLYTCGCSWTAGEELADITDRNRPSIMYYNSWPWFLAENLNIPVMINEGRGSGSNFRIFRRTSEYLIDYISRGEDPHDLLIVLGWTTPERYEIGVGKRIIPMNIQRPLIPRDLDHMKDELSAYNQQYYNLYSDEYGERLQLLFMNNLRTLCKSLGIKYYDFIALGKPKDQLSEYKKFDNLLEECYGAFVANNNLPVHEFKHPTKETHKIWADLLCKKILIS